MLIRILPHQHHVNGRKDKKHMTKQTKEHSKEEDEHVGEESEWILNLHYSRGDHTQNGQRVQPRMIKCNQKMIHRVSSEFIY